MTGLNLLAKITGLNLLAIEIKLWGEILSFILEDSVEIGLQYFFFEKFQFTNDKLTYINAGFMIAKGIELTVRGVIEVKDSMSEQESF